MKCEILDRIIIQSIWRSQYPNEISINEEALEQTLDEMRKEFPKFKQFELPTIDDIKIDWKKACKMMELQTIKREKWFTKWLSGRK